MPPVRLVAALALALVLAAPAVHAQGRHFGPWPEAVPAKERPAVTREPDSSPVKLPFLWSLWFYRNAISPLDGVRCGLYPTCSGYASEAIRTHGVLAGGFLAADRLIHEGTARPPEYDVIEKFERRFVHDPVSANDRLFRKETQVADARSVVFSGFAVGEGVREPPVALVRPSEAEALARRLTEAGDRYAAVGEWRRAAFLTRDDVAGAALLLEGGLVAAEAGAEARRAKPLSYAAGREAFEEANRMFEAAERRGVRAGDGEAARRARYARALGYLANGYLLEAARRFKAEALEGRDALANDAAWLAAWSEWSRDMALGRTPGPAARDRFEPFLEDGDARAAIAKELISEAESERFRRKSPTAAAVMSFVLPGSGWVYAGRPLVGLGSFVLNGAFIAGTVYAFRDGNYPLAAILLSLETGWYVGGASGAALAVAERNDLGRDRLERRMRKKFMGAVWPGGAAGALLF